MAVPDRLRYARERAGLTGSQVRERAGIGESTLSELEHGKREPSLSQLQALAKLYQRSMSFFLSEEPLPREIVLWRKRPSKEAELIETRFLRLCEQYHNLEVWCGEPAPVELPEVELKGRSFGYGDAEELARRVRKELGLGDRPAQELLPVLEEACGVKVFHLDFEPDGTAASTVSESFGPAVLLNTRNARWRRNHDLAHELFHLLTWRLFRGTGSVQTDDREEKLATCFARNLLMPPDAIRSAVNVRLKDGKLPLAALFDIAREFDVSVESLLWHLLYVYPGQWNKQEVEEQIEKAKALAPFYENRAQDAPPTRPARFRALAVKAIRRGDLSAGRFAEYLDVSRQEAMRFAEQEVTGDEEIQVTPA